jgi:hypothetical protein
MVLLNKLQINTFDMEAHILLKFWYLYKVTWFPEDWQS